MKQLVLVLLIAATALSVSAQREYRDHNRKNKKHDRVDRHYKNNTFSQREREEYRRQLERINHDFDGRIRSVARNPWISKRRKADKIHDLEVQRRYALNECRSRFHRQMDYTDRGKKNRRR